MKETVAWSQALADAAPGFDPALLTHQNLERALLDPADDR